MKTYKKYLCMKFVSLACILSGIVAIATVAETWYLGNVVDTLSTAGDTIMYSILCIISMVIVEYIGNTCKSFLKGYSINKTSSNLRAIISEKLINATYCELQKKSTGDLISLYISDIEQVRKYQQTLIEGFGGIVAAIVSIIICFKISWKFFVISILCLPLMIWLGSAFRGKLEFSAYLKRIKIGESNKELLNCIQNRQCIKSYNIEDYMIQKYDDVLSTEKDVSVKDAVNRGIVKGINRITGAMPYLILFGTGAVLIWHGEISLGEFFSFSYIFSNVQSIQNLQDILAERKSYKASEKRIAEVLSISSEAIVGDVNSTKDIIDEGLYIKNLSFFYDDGNYILKNTSAYFRTGEKIAIIGESGSGKSTLLKIITGLYTPDEGDIYLAREGKIYRGVEYQKKIGVVLQDNYLFPLTIRENIKIGFQNATDDDIKEACEKAGIWKDIQKMKDGLDTKIQEKGISLSGGQKQRICIARALVGNPQILIMDEPSASLDSIHEEELMRTLCKECEKRILLVISHRESTVQYADVVYVVKNKRLVKKI